MGTSRSEDACEASDELCRTAQIVSVDLNDTPPERLQPGSPRHIGAPLDGVAMVVALVLDYDAVVGEYEIAARDEPAAAVEDVLIGLRVRKARRDQQDAENRLLRRLRPVVEKRDRSAKRADAPRVAAAIKRADQVTECRERRATMDHEVSGRDQVAEPQMREVQPGAGGGRHPQTKSRGELMRFDLQSMTPDPGRMRRPRGIR